MSRRGIKAFNRCDVKVVEFKNYSFPRDTKGEDIANHSGLIVLKSGDTPKLVRSNPNAEVPSGWSAGSGAILHCPMTEDERVDIESEYTNHSTHLGALESVRSLAGSLLCEHCRYSTMSPADVSMERAKIAHAEADRLESEKLRAQAIQELIEIDPGFRDLGAPS